jgi:hypothetical protein
MRRKPTTMMRSGRGNGEREVRRVEGDKKGGGANEMKS